MSEEVFDVYTHTVPCQHVREYGGATIDGNDHILLLSVKKYVPRGRILAPAEGVTILAAGGNGFPKELYEPLWADLFAQSKAGSFNINAIWIADMAHQGESGILNEGKLGDDPSWFDNGRDLLQIVNHFRDEMTRPIVGIGHSIGTNALINLAVFHPILLSHLMLIEPILGDCTREGIFFAYHGVNAPHHWSSRAEAESFQRKRPPFSAFDDRVLQRWVQYGLRARSDGSTGVELVTSKHQEAVTYVRPLFERKEPTGIGEHSVPDFDDAVDNGRSFYCPASLITMRRLPELRPSVHWIFGNKSVMSPPAKQKQILESTGTGLGGSGAEPYCTIVERGGHLIPFEDPALCAEAMAVSLGRFVSSRNRDLLWSSFDHTNMQVSEEWRKHAKQELDAMARAKKSKL